jgi:hypothetical protein
MLSLFHLLTAILLLPHPFKTAGVCTAAQKKFEQMSPNLRSQMLRQRIRFNGCYDATFSFWMLGQSPHIREDCLKHCEAISKKWKILFPDALKRTYNQCIAEMASLEATEAHQLLDNLPNDQCGAQQQCKCQVDLIVRNILLSRPEGQQVQVKGPAKLANEAAMPGLPNLATYGSNATPKNCNASGLAPWLALKLGPQVHVIISQVTIDPVCPAYDFFRDASAQTLAELIKESRGGRNEKDRENHKAKKEAAKAAKEKGESSASRPKKKSRKADTCPMLRPREEAFDGNPRVCPRIPEAGDCHVPGSSQQGTPAPAQEVTPSEGIEETRITYYSFFPEVPGILPDDVTDTAVDDEDETQ